MLIPKWRNLYIEIPHICWRARILHTFDLPKIVKMMTMIMCCSGDLANGVNDNYCSIFLQSSSVSSSLRDLGKQIAGSKLPGRLAQRWHRSGTTLVQRWRNSSSPSSFPFPRRLRQQVAHRPQMPSTYVSRPKKFPGLRTQLPIPGFSSQDLVTPVATSIKTLASEVVRGMS